MSKIAVDVALLLPKEVSLQAIQYSERLKDKPEDTFTLGNNDFFPHVTILMGVMEDSVRERLIKKLNEIAEDIPPIFLESPGIKLVVSSSGDPLSVIEIQKNAPLQKLHAEVISGLSPLFSFEATKDMFVEPETIRDSTISFVKKFPAKFDFSNYHPHITLGKGIPDDSIGPFSFKAFTLAVCQMGEFSTCRKILYSISLKGGE